MTQHISFEKIVPYIGFFIIIFLIFLFAGYLAQTDQEGRSGNLVIPSPVPNTVSGHQPIGCWFYSGNDPLLGLFEERLELMSVGTFRSEILAPSFSEEPVGIIGSSRDITEKKRAEEAWEEAFAQIEENIYQASILNDQIRNPMAVIMGLADLEGGERMEKIINEVKKIDEIINQLDRGVLESESIRAFMRKRYEKDRYGYRLDEDEELT